MPIIILSIKKCNPFFGYFPYKSFKLSSDKYISVCYNNGRTKTYHRTEVVG